MTTLQIRQRPVQDGKYPITLTLKRPGQADLEAEASIEFALTEQEQEDLRWYLDVVFRLKWHTGEVRLAVSREMSP